MLVNENQLPLSYLIEMLKFYCNLFILAKKESATSFLSLLLESILVQIDKYGCGELNSEVGHKLEWIECFKDQMSLLFTQSINGYMLKNLLHLLSLYLQYIQTKKLNITTFYKL